MPAPSVALRRPPEPNSPTAPTRFHTTHLHPVPTPEPELRRSCSPSRADNQPTRSFVERHLDTLFDRIDRLCRRQRLYDEEAEDFRSYALVRLVSRSQRLEDLFEGRSHLVTYVDSILTNMLRDFRIQKWGKWRASAAARDLGPTAMKLERLVYRDRLHPSDAVRVLVHSEPSDHSSAEQEEQLWTVLAELPNRVDRRPADLPDNFQTRFTDPRQVSLADCLVHQEEVQRLCVALRTSLSCLNRKQRKVLRLRYCDGLNFAQIETETGMRKESLYRLVARALRKLRAQLAAQGIDFRAILAANGGGSNDFCLDHLFADASVEA